MLFQFILQIQWQFLNSGKGEFGTFRLGQVHLGKQLFLIILTYLYANLC